MKVKQLRNESMTRSYRVELNQKEFQSELHKALVTLGEIGGNSRLKRGRITLEEADRRFGEETVEVAFEEVVDAAVDVLLNKTGDSVMAPPNFESVTCESGGFPDRAFSFVVTYDLKPRIPEVDFSGLDFKRLVATPSDDELDYILKGMSMKLAEKDGPAEHGDLVIVSFSGTVDGKSFAGGEEEDMKLAIGSGFMPGLEEKFVGLSAGDRKTVEALFPDRMPERFGSGAELIAGRTAEFDVEVKGVKSIEDVEEINEDFAKRR